MHTIAKIAIFSVRRLLNLSINSKGWNRSFTAESQNMLPFCAMNILQGTVAFYTPTIW